MTYISAKRREKSATVHVGKKAKYPVDSHKTAESAVRLINNAKPALTESQREHVLSEAAHYGVRPKSAKTTATGAPPKGAKSTKRK